MNNEAEFEQTMAGYVEIAEKHYVRFQLEVTTGVDALKHQGLGIVASCVVFSYMVVLKNLCRKIYIEEDGDFATIDGMEQKIESSKAALLLAYLAKPDEFRQDFDAGYSLMENNPLPKGLMSLTMATILMEKEQC